MSFMMPVSLDPPTTTRMSETMTVLWLCRCLGISKLRGLVSNENQILDHTIRAILDFKCMAIRLERKYLERIVSN